MPRKSSSSVKVFFPSLDKAAVLRRLREGVPRLDAVLPLRRVVLFGSYARGTHTVASDVDLLVVYRGAARPDAYAAVRRALGLPRLEPHVYAEAEYAAAAATIDRMTDGGEVILAR